MHQAMNNQGGRGWEGESRGVYVQFVPPRGDCLPLAVIMAIWSMEGTEKQVRALRKQIRDVLVQDKSIKRAWEANFKDKWNMEAKGDGGCEAVVDEDAMAREWEEEVALTTGTTKNGGPAYMTPIHVKALAMITGRPIIVVAMNDGLFSSMEAMGQFGGIYRAQPNIPGEREKSKRAVVLGYANSHFGTIVKWPGAHRAQSVQIGSTGNWNMPHQFDGAQDGHNNDFLHAIEDREGKVWADMYMGGREGREWSTNKEKVKQEAERTSVKKEPMGRGHGQDM